MRTWEQAQQKARRQTIFQSNGALVIPRSDKPTICNIHLVLAHAIDALAEVQESQKKELLFLVDRAYNCGKRMAAKLDFYHGKYPHE